MCPLVFAEILEVFVNTLTSDGKYPLQCCENFQLLIQMQLSEKRKTFSKFLFHFWILHQILNILNEKMIIIANVFPKLQTVKIFLRPLSKKLRFRNTLWQSTCESVPNVCKISMGTFLSCSSSFLGSLILKTSPTVPHEFPGLFVYTLTADGKLSCSRLWEFATPNSNPVIWTTKNFSWIFCYISGFCIKFWTFWEKRWTW